MVMMMHTRFSFPIPCTPRLVLRLRPSLRRFRRACSKSTNLLMLRLRVPMLLCRRRPHMHVLLLLLRLMLCMVMRGPVANHCCTPTRWLAIQRRVSTEYLCELVCATAQRVARKRPAQQAGRSDGAVCVYMGVASLHHHVCCRRHKA